MTRFYTSAGDPIDPRDVLDEYGYDRAGTWHTCPRA